MDSKEDSILYQGFGTESERWHLYLLKALIDNMPDLIYFKDRNSRFVRINPAMAKKFKLQNVEDAYGLTDFDFFGPEHAHEAYRDEQNIIRTGIPIVSKEELETWKDSPPTWVSSTKMPLYDDQGNVIGTFGISREITENKKLRQAIQEKLESLTSPSADDQDVRFDDLFDLREIQRIQDEFSAATGVASVITYPNGVPITKTSRFTRFCNLVRKTDKGCENCHNSDAILGAKNLDNPIIRPCLSAGLWDAGASISVGGRHVANWLIGQIRDENSEDSKDEASIRRYARAIGMDEEELTAAFYEVPSMSLQQFSDIAKSLHTFAGQLAKSAYHNLLQARFIAEQTRFTEELQERENRLEQLNATKDKFFSIIAHDLKNPFNSILNFSDLVLEKLDKHQYDKAGEYTTIIQQSSVQALDLLTNLLEWARSQTGSLTFVPRNLDLTELIGRVTSMSGCAATGKSIQIEVDMPGSVTVMADPDMIGTVLRNLLCNAVKFSNPGTTITVGFEQNATSWTVWVRDAGVGIPASNLERLFRIEESFTTKGTGNEPGTGLGLVLCKELVEKHGGKIWAESTTGKGTTVSFTIPNQFES